MAREWENPGFRRRKRLTFLIALLLSVSAVWFLLRPGPQPLPPDKSRVRSVSVAKPQPARETPSADAPVTSESWEIPIPSSPEPSRPEGDASLRRANQAFAAGDFAEAARLFLEMAVTEERFRTFAGLAFYRMREYETAILQLEQAVRGNPSDFLAHKFLALAWYQSDDLEKSLEHVRVALALQPDRELEAFFEKLTREKEVQSGFVDVETPNFRILFDGQEQRETKRSVINLLKEAYSSVGKKLDLFPAEPVTVILYSDRDFAAATGAPGWAGGLYDGKIRVPVRGVAGREAALRRILYHEYTHALVHSITPVCPLWVQEGLAEYCSGSRLPRIGQIIPLERLENAFPGLDGRSAFLAYMESHAAVAALIDRFGLDRLKRFLQALGSGEKLDEAFQRAFYLSYKRFLAEWGRQTR